MFDGADQKSGNATVLATVALESPATVEFRCWGSTTGIWVPTGSTPAMHAIQVGALGQLTAQ